MTRPRSKARREPHDQRHSPLVTERPEASQSAKPHGSQPPTRLVTESPDDARHDDDADGIPTPPRPSTGPHHPVDR